MLPPVLYGVEQKEAYSCEYGKGFILFLFISYCVIFPMNNDTPTLAPLCILQTNKQKTKKTPIMYTDTEATIALNTYMLVELGALWKADGRCCSQRLP